VSYSQLSFHLFLCLSSVLLSSSAWAQRKKAEPSISKAEPATPWKFTNQIEWYNVYKATEFKQPVPLSDQSPFNPPANQYLTDFRWTFSAEKDRWLFVVTPRVEANYAEETGGRQEFFFQDGYTQWMNPDHQIRLGVQNFQWGPAELLSPSNPIFHFDQRQRWFFYQQRGQGLARWNWNLSSNWTVSAVSEFFQSSQETFIENEKFQPSGLLKTEFRGDSGQNYLGLTGGVTPTQHPFVGEYFAYYLSDAFSFYADARQTQGDNAYRPVLQPTGFELQQTQKKSNQVQTFSAAGFRYEGRADFRIEYIFNEAGLTKTQWQQTLLALALQSPFRLANQKKFDRSGHEILGTNLLYLSLRVPDLGKSQAYAVFLRNLHSLDDNSGDVQFSLERAFGNSLTIYAEATTFYGAPDSYFGSTIDWEGLLGVKWSY
jgi:hypothetical protein